MKKLLFISLLLLFTLVVKATTYYISTTGTDGAGHSGLIGDPFRTLSYACTRATVSGDIIHVNEGSHTSSSQSVLAVGVSIEGAGVTSIISSTVGGSNFTIRLASTSYNTNGNQHIRNIKMDGNNLTAYAAIEINRRGGVEIDNCTFINFNYYGIAFWGIQGAMVEPATGTRATNNKFHDNIVTNCAKYVYTRGDPITYPIDDYGNGDGSLEINQQETMLIYNNTITQYSRTETYGNYAGYCIKGVYGLNRDIKIYNNVFDKGQYDGITWDFAIELWASRGGIEIYDNEFIGGSIDFSGGGLPGVITTQKGNYAYSAWVHHNTFYQPSLLPLVGTRAILLEQSCEDAIFEYNTTYNTWAGIYCPLLVSNSSARVFKNIYIRYNKFYNIGIADGSSVDRGYGIYMPIYPVLTTGWVCDNVNIYNNVIAAKTTGSNKPPYGIILPAMGATTNVRVRNNIVTGFASSAIYGLGASGVTLDYLYIDNNIFYQNGNTILFSSLSPSHYTPTNNLSGSSYNPLFVSSTDFHLQAGSPAINSGMNVSIAYDFAGATVNPTTPERGVYEYGSTVPVASITVAGTGGATTISTDDGTLQMIATVLPVNATDPSVTWSRINGTGTANISAGGLLTALSNGTVTTRATANDGTGIYGDRVITISNQTPDPILVTSITVSGTGGATTITTAGGTLQMLKSVLPANATNQNVTWTVTPGTGNGSIGSSSGILTAIDDGTITVRATALDGSAVYDDQVITISNQTFLDKTDGIVAYWSLNETGAGANAIDAVGTNDLPNTGVTTNQPGKVGTSFSFAGSVNSFLGGTDIPAFEFTTALSVSAWINPASTTSWQGLVTYFYYADDSGWDVNVDYQDKAAMTVRSPTQTPNNTVALGTTVLGTGNWIHIACTWDGTYVKTYVGGVLETTSTAWNHPITYNSLARFMIGMRYNDIPYTGRIDEVALYNRAISQTNVTDLKAAGEAGLSYPFIPVTLPTVVTDSIHVVSEIPGGYSTISIYVNVTDDGAANIDTAGFLVGLSSNPTFPGYLGVHYILTANEGSQFFSYFASPEVSTTYYIRSFAINSAGISYGNQFTYTTPGAPIPSVYKFVKRGGMFLKRTGSFVKKTE